MALPVKLTSLSPSSSCPTNNTLLFLQNIHPIINLSSYPSSPSPILIANYSHCCSKSKEIRTYCFRVRYRLSGADEEEDEDHSFEEAVELFNKREYYKCHDYLEAQWMEAQEPLRTLLHGILQCAVGFHHLFNQNHKGAMMELGEGLCKLRKMNFKSGPFLDFELQISAALDFIYQTQIELAACAEDMCLAMDQSERSYQLLGGYGAGQRLYDLQTDQNQIVYIEFSPHRSNISNIDPQRVKLPILEATQDHLMALS